MTDSSKTAKKTEGIQRRFFFKKTSSALIFGGALAYGLGSSFLLEGREKRLRPPGALEEDLFLASCIKCGQCLQVCPPQVILLAGLADGNGIGTPFIVPRDGGCILCKGLPCVLACPTGALDHHISEGSEAEMGITVLSHPETCLARSGTNDIIHQMQTLLEKESSGTTAPSRKVRRQWNRVM
ncbi:MAG: 4Fe-4S dicluster domain-containing protein, partial [Deltaproteobacteria bacterium]